MPLPDEPQGEAIAFAPDGTLLSAGESPPGAPGAPGAPAPRHGALRAVPGAVAAAEAGQPRGADRSGPAPTAPTPGPAPANLAATRGSTSASQWIAAAIVLVLGAGLLAAAALRERRRSS